MDKSLLDLYTDYLLVSTNQANATGLSRMLDNSVSHDQITRFLSKQDFGSKDLWKIVKGSVRNLEKQEGLSWVLLDDSVEAKPYTDENELISWHYDHVSGRSVKGVNQLSVLFYRSGVSIPIGLEFVKKDQWAESKSGKPKRKSSVSKQHHFRNLTKQASFNLQGIDYVLADKWFASAENMRFLKEQCQCNFIMPLKNNRKLALSLQDKETEEYRRVDALDLQEGQSVEIYLEQVDFSLKLTKAVYENKDGSLGVLYLVTSDLPLSGEQIKAFYGNRWKIEEMYKSLKSNASYVKSPTRTVRTQTNHFFCTMVAFWKLERIKMRVNINHFALKGKLYLQAIKTAYKYLNDIKETLNLQGLA